MPTAVEVPSAIAAEIGALTPLVQRVVRARVSNPEVAADLSQETLRRVVDAEQRLTPESLAAYAVVTARNVVANHARSEARWRRRLPAALERLPPPEPDEATLVAEEHHALRRALESLGARERDELVAHEVDGTSTSDLAVAAGSTPGAIAVRLARTRAKLRVDYVVALRQATLPTPVCRGVLLALSAGDRRRQAALGAGPHLEVCDTCAALSEPLLQRRRGLAAATWPISLLGGVGGALARQFRQHPVRSSTASAAAALALAGASAALVAGPSSDPPPDSTTRSPTVTTVTSPPIVPARLTVQGRRVADLATTDLTGLVGQAVEGRSVAVESVPADEGFWVGPDVASRFWVQLVRRGESPVAVEAGRRISFVGTLAAHDGSFSQHVGVDEAEGAAQLTARAHHIEVAREDLRQD